jgi:hypothetical protein
MSKPATQAERLIRIETLLETKLDAIAEGQAAGCSVSEYLRDIVPDRVGLQ